ncbi:CinA family protein [Gulosibacter macacae]|uniref:CinA family protein n=1 Tax=Gulosibacter macacae TaxID=2488791 RepID=A0A3P3VY63_9MICO|nr:CinA family protein [Gulosibacter macacae]RRJ85613.1 CinA family protein [Gulosibacter macacae]
MFTDATSAQVTRIADALLASGRSIAVAESLTCGQLTHALGSGHDTHVWLRGGATVYQTDVKQDVLGVSPGPVVTAKCAEELAAGAARVFGADVAIATTGVGGPGPEEGEPQGTVFIGWCLDGTTGSERHDFAGSPVEVLDQATDAALAAVARLVDRPNRPSGD